LLRLTRVPLPDIDPESLLFKHPPTNEDDRKLIFDQGVFQHIDFDSVVDMHLNPHEEGGEIGKNDAQATVHAAATTSHGNTVGKRKEGRAKAKKKEHGIKEKETKNVTNKTAAAAPKDLSTTPPITMDEDLQVAADQQLVDNTAEVVEELQDGHQYSSKVQGKRKMSPPSERPAKRRQIISNESAPGNLDTGDGSSFQKNSADG
jgi:hypothetical protein